MKCEIQINNMPKAIVLPYVVARRCDDDDVVSIWYYGQYKTLKQANDVAIEIGNGFVVKAEGGESMMTLNEAIAHCKKVETEQAMNGRYKCAEDHQQLAEYLFKLKKVAQVVNEYENGVYSSVEPAVLALDLIQDILEEGGGV